MRLSSLGARMALLFSVLLAAIGVFMLAFFPARMAKQSQADAEERATSLAQVMATALVPAVEFDDPENASSILQWLVATHDARFGLVRKADGKMLAVWRPDEVPVHHAWASATNVDIEGELLFVTVPIAQTGGMLDVGFSLEQLSAERDQMRKTVGLTVLLIVAVGVLATLGFAAYLLRPVRVLTKTALDISRGEGPPELPHVAGADELIQLAAALRVMLERIHESSQQELLAASRQAGMAEVATGVLHNVGNVLTAVNVTVDVMRERLESHPHERLFRLRDLLAASVESGSVDIERVRTAVKYLDVLGETLEKARERARADFQTLASHIDHVKRVVSMQNAYARIRSAAEPTRVGDVIAEAIEIACPPHRRGDIAIEVTVDDSLASTSVMADRHRILQILVNLVSNARDAVQAQQGTQRIAIAAERDGKRMHIRVIDSGVGISPELAAKIFGAGVTSKANGHGYGLHSSALAARQMNGVLECTSAGTGAGATFTLTIPFEELKS
ncbi:MAG: ATP-binding protein [Kofleriaceae bacterium]